jgi:hypothetical protein
MRCQVGQATPARLDRVEHPGIGVVEIPGWWTSDECASLVSGPARLGKPLIGGSAALDQRDSGRHAGCLGGLTHGRKLAKRSAQWLFHDERNAALDQSETLFGHTLVGTKDICESDTGEINQGAPVGFNRRTPAFGQLLHLHKGNIVITDSDHLVLFRNGPRTERNVPMGSTQNDCSYVSQPRYPLV